MNHYTLNTGHNRESPRSEVSDDAIAVCRQLLSPGRHQLPGVIGGYTLAVPLADFGWLGTVYQARAPIATIGVAVDERDATIIWPAIVKMYGADVEAPPLPWCAVVLHVVSPAYEWLGDFERCMAWAWIETNNERKVQA